MLEHTDSGLFPLAPEAEVVLLQVTQELMQGSSLQCLPQNQCA